jgi:cell division protein FtsW (lipid II flippase)
VTQEHAPSAGAPPIRRVRPRWRGREARLLSLVGLVLLVGWVGLASTEAQQLTLGDPRALLVLLAMLAAVHLVLVVDGRRRDQVLLPVVGLLMGLSVLLMSRLPQDLVVQSLGPIRLPLVSLQLLWIGLSLGIAAIIAVGLRNDLVLRSYKYTWAVAGIVLLLLVFVLGDETNGARLTLHVGPFAGQPSELLKIILVVFLAAYLADNRALLSGRDSRLGPIRLPPLLYLLPMLVIWGLALATVVVQRDLGAALLFYGVFLLLLYVATQRRDLLAIGVVLFLVGGVVLYALFPHVQERVEIWLDPFATAQGAGFQIVRGLYALGRGGVVGTGLGAGLPGVGGAQSIPAVHTDFVFAALGEELGLAGGLAILALYAVFAERGLRIAAGARDEFRTLLAAGLTLVIVVQAAIIVAGNAKLIPLTGITLPWIAYGGSSMLAGGIVLGLLLSIAVEERPGAAPERVGWRERVADASRAAAGRVERVLR